MITTAASNSTLDIDASQSIATLTHSGAMDIASGVTLTQTGAAASVIAGTITGAGTYTLNDNTSAMAVTWGSDIS